MEFKRGKTEYDPYMDFLNDYVLPAPAGSRKRVRGQLITYGEFLLAVQQRLAVFMPVIHGRRIRFIRWDRSGSIVTQSFDYYLNWEFFCDVLCRISMCSDVQLGFDPTAARLLPGDPDYEKMDEVAISRGTDLDHTERLLEDGDVPQSPFVFSYVRTLFRESLHPLWPRYRLQVPDGDQIRYFLVSKPSFRAKGLAGRGTRGHVAFDCSTGRFVWLKDAWRTYYLLVEKEGDVLAELNKANIHHVPTLVCHGDVDEQDTLTPSWWERKNPQHSRHPSSCAPSSSANRAVPSSWSSLKRKRQDDDDEDDKDSSSPKGPSESKSLFRSDCPLRLHRHYRLVVEEVALPLKDFLHGRQLVSVIKDCVHAHWKACTKTNILHRDVSGGNILFCPTLMKTRKGWNIKWMGILADWEISKPVKTAGEPRRPRQPERTGTWQYMSVALLNHNKIDEICDELEAFAYVLIYYTARYLKSNCDGVSIALFLDAFFDTFGFTNGTYVCGGQNLAAIKNGELLVSGSTYLRFSSPMDTLLKTLLSWFRAHHIVTTHERLKAEKVKALPVTTPTTALNPVLEGYESEEDEEDLGLSEETIALDDSPMPSAKDHELSAKVLDHMAMLRLLKQSTGASDWFEDKAGDVVPSDWKVPEKPCGPTLQSALSESIKKRRLAVSEPIGLVAVSEPPVTPPRRGHSTLLATQGRAE